MTRSSLGSCFVVYNITSSCPLVQTLKCSRVFVIAFLFIEHPLIICCVNWPGEWSVKIKRNKTSVCVDSERDDKLLKHTAVLYAMKYI